MLFKWNLFCFRPCSTTTGPDISKLQPEEAAGPTCHHENAGSINQRNGDKGGYKDEEETSSSSASRSRKSFSSFAKERGFLKCVVGSHDKDRGFERERDPVVVHNGLKANSHDSQKMEEKPEQKADNIVHEAKYMKTVSSKDDKEEEEIIRGRKPSKLQAAFSNGNEGVEEDSILCYKEPPSFRVYCVHNVSVDGDSNEENGDKEKENESPKETEKRSEKQTVLETRKAKFRAGLRNGGQARMANFLLLSCSCPKSQPINNSGEYCP